MKIVEAMAVGRGAVGYRVHWEVREAGLLRSDYTPDREETPFPTLGAAWAFASYFETIAPPEYVNIYVVASDWVPVEGYMRRVLRPYPSKAE